MWWLLPVLELQGKQLEISSLQPQLKRIKEMSSGIQEYIQEGF